MYVFTVEYGGSDPRRYARIYPTRKQAEEERSRIMRRDVGWVSIGLVTKKEVLILSLHPTQSPT